MRPSQLGDVCKYTFATGDHYYLVTKVGAKGGCSGVCIFPAKFADGRTYSPLKPKTWLVPPEKIPDHVNVALATRALLGKAAIE